MGSYIALLVATFAPFAVALFPVGSKEKVGKRLILTEGGWMEQ